MTIAIICGGRDFNEKRFIEATLDKLHAKRPFSFVFTGGASGVDYHADQWAKRVGVDRIQVWANWQRRGDSAGPFRNRLMVKLAKPQVIIAFPGGKGTMNMVDEGRKAGVPIMAVEFRKAQRDAEG